MIRPDNENKYWDADYGAKWYSGETPAPAVTTTINNHTITVEYKLVNRKCYDNLSTPTRNVTLDGKRTSLANLIKAINS